MIVEEKTVPAPLAGPVVSLVNDTNAIRYETRVEQLYKEIIRNNIDKA